MQHMMLLSTNAKTPAVLIVVLVISSSSSISVVNALRRHGSIIVKSSPSNNDPADDGMKNQADSLRASSSSSSSLSIHMPTEAEFWDKIAEITVDETAKEVGKVAAEVLMQVDMLPPGMSSGAYGAIKVGLSLANDMAAHRYARPAPHDICVAPLPSRASSDKKERSRRRAHEGRRYCCEVGTPPRGIATAFGNPRSCRISSDFDKLVDYCADTATKRGVKSKLVAVAPAEWDKGPDRRSVVLCRKTRARAANNDCACEIVRAHG